MSIRRQAHRTLDSFFSLGADIFNKRADRSIVRKAHFSLDCVIDLARDIRQNKDNNTAVAVEISVHPGPPKGKV